MEVYEPVIHRLPMPMGRVLITGGAGYLGRAILRQAEAERWPCEFTVLSRDEEKLYRVKRLFPRVRVVAGSITDRDVLNNTVAGHDIVIHAAAVKYVPEAEFAAADAYRINCLGSYNVAQACVQHGVSRAILISTDKACMPVNLYGATKMVAEKLWSEANVWGETLFVTARYGNVVGSTGSIVPVFARQLKEKGRVTVTDPTMTRFWMSPAEAIGCITDALHLADVAPGAVFAARCPQMSIGELAEIICRMALPDGEDYSVLPIDVTGPRPGEKHDEVLVHQYEWPRMFEYMHGFVIVPSTADVAVVRSQFNAQSEGGLPGPQYSSDGAPAIGSVRMRALIEASTLI